MLGVGQQHTGSEHGVTSPSSSMLLARGQSSALPRLSTILPGAAAGESNANNKQADAYITELLSYSLDRLRKEPELLLEERQQVERSMQSSALGHYHAFIDSANCLSVVQRQLSNACEGLAGLSQSVPDLAGAFESFSKDAAHVMAQHNANKQLLAQQATVLELLDAPQLMDTCVRNGIYDEALDLHAFIMRVALLHPDLPLVKLLAAQAQAVSQAMLGQLLQRLRTNIQLPECLRAVGYLRRMASFPEGELRLHFLRCREEWLAQLISELDSSDSYEYVKHLTDVHRLHLFDIVMQYRAIFFDGSSQDSKASAGNTLEGCVLFTWVQHRVSHYIAALQQHLPGIEEGTQLASALEHATYCCSSLSRVGLDFSCLLAPLFQLCALRLFGAKLALAVDAFHQRLDSHKWVVMPAPLLGKAAGAAGAADGSEQQLQGSAGAGAGDDLAPPYTLMEHVPLAVFTNGVLSALNELRHCALLPLQRPAGTLLQGSLEQVASSMVHYRHTRSLATTEQALFAAASRALSDVVVPYLAGCFAAVFPGGSSLLSAVAVTAVLKDAAVSRN
eukprot:GHRQ01004499.1.p1 GENE.GHRQ01004499.1~~GHRQ01004499.1.p1  ORF type:complete len:562 (+),score=212.75 GHRQ01004499.1:522-2207(+)